MVNVLTNDVTAARYALRLEAQALADPFQWYNFFDFWARPAPVDAR